MHVTVMISSYDRIDTLKKAIRSVENSTYQDLSLAVIIDGHAEAYKEIKRFLRKVNLDSLLLFNKHRRDIVFSYNKTIKLISEGAVLYATDDIEFRPVCIARAVMEMMRRYPKGDGQIGLNQLQNGYPKGRRYAFSLIGRRMIERFPNSIVFCPDYLHFNLDRELGIFAQTIHRFVFCEEAILDHYRIADNTTRLGLNIYKQDRATWNERQKRKWLWGKNFHLLKEQK